MIRVKNILRIIILSMVIISLPIEEAQGSRLWDFVYKRYLKRNKLKKLYPRLMSKEKDLSAMEIRSIYEVFGYEPSWNLDRRDTWQEDDIYYFNLLSSLVCGEYDINPDNGDPRNSKFFYQPLKRLKEKKTKKAEVDLVSIYEEARLQNPRIKLMISLNFSGDYGLPSMRGRYEHDLLNDEDLYFQINSNIRDFFSKASNLFGGKDDGFGVVIDFKFENPSLDRGGFVEFIEKLKSDNPNLTFCLKLPPVLHDQGSAYPSSFIKALIQSEFDPIDFYLMEANGYEKTNPENLISTCNFDDNSKYSVQASIEHYLAFEEEEDDEFSIEELQQTLNEKLIIEFPMYGSVWKKANSYDSKLEFKKNDNYLSFDNFFNEFLGKGDTVSYTKDSMALYYYNELTQEVAYGEDSTTFFRKASYVIDTLKLRGFGINHLSQFYRKKGTEPPRIWRAFANSELEVTRSRQTFGWIVASFIIVFIPIGFVYSVGYYWQVRNALAKHKKYYRRTQWFFGLFFFAWLVVSDILPRNEIGLILGLLILAFLVIYILIKKVIIRSKKYVNALK